MMPSEEKKEEALSRSLMSNHAAAGHSYGIKKRCGPVENKRSSTICIQNIIL